MQVIVDGKYNEGYLSSTVKRDVPIKVWVKELDGSETWYLVDANNDPSSLIDTDNDSTMIRVFTDPKYRGIKRHRCYWVNGRYCKEVSINNNHDALSLLRRN